MSLIPSNYFESREQFKNLANALDARLNSFPIESLSGVNGTLAVDTAFIGDDTSHSLIIIVSGVHGVEGYAGAACMKQFMKMYRAEYSKTGVAFLLIHALNPWGFANDSRVTEGNVDLNRNFIDFSEVCPLSSGYELIHPILCKNYKPGLSGLLNELRLFASLIGQRRRRAFQEAVTAGQYSFSEGLFYGGCEPTPNRHILTHILQTCVRPDQQVRLLDIHTGLGHQGQGSLITHLPEDSSKFKTLNRWLGEQLTSSANGTAVSTKIKGHLPAYVEQYLGDNCFAITLEFGVAATERVNLICTSLSKIKLHLRL